MGVIQILTELGLGVVQIAIKVSGPSRASIDIGQTTHPVSVYDAKEQGVKPVMKDEFGNSIVFYARARSTAGPYWYLQVLGATAAETIQELGTKLKEQPPHLATNKSVILEE